MEDKDLIPCPVCGYEATGEPDLQAHFEVKATDEAHKEYNLNPKDNEVINEESIGAPAGTPGHPGIDEGTEE